MKIAILKLIEIICICYGIYIPYVHLRGNFSREKSPHIDTYCWGQSVCWFMVLCLGIPGMIHGLLIKTSEKWTTLGSVALMMTIAVLFISFVLFMTYEFPWKKLFDFFKW